MVISKIETSVEQIERLKSGDLQDLCDATEAAIIDGGGFGWVDPPSREVMERYWRGVMLIPERTLFVGRLDGVICGSAQLLEPSRNNEAQTHACSLTTAFMAPWARGFGIARRLTQVVEAEARRRGFKLLNLDVRETQTRAIQHYESLGFRRWGCHPDYARVKGTVIRGLFYYKPLDDSEAGGDASR